MFDKLIKIAVSTATLPISIAADKTGIPLLINGKSATQKNVKDVVDSVMDLLE